MHIHLAKLIAAFALMTINGGCGLANPVSGYIVECGERKITAVIPQWGKGRVEIDNRRIPATYGRLATGEERPPLYFDFFDGDRQARLTINHYWTKIEKNDEYPNGANLLTSSSTLDYINTDELPQICSAPSAFVT